MTVQVVLIFLGSVASALFAFVLFYLGDVRNRMTEQETRHERLQQEVSDLKANLPSEYVRREDWIMSFSKIEQKIDAIWDFVHRQEKRQESREE